MLLYQEQALQIAHNLALFSYGEAETLYRFLTKAERSDEELAGYRECFLAGALDNGMDRETATDLWKYLAQGTGYAFPKGHAVAYAGLAFEALWLKRYYPAELLCALMNHQPCGSYPPRVLVMEARRLSIGVKPLDVNASSMSWTTEDGALRVGLRQLKGMTDLGLRRIMLAQRDRPFNDFEDFVLRTWLPNQLLENLVLVGAFDSFEANRDDLLAELPLVLRRRRKAGRYALGFPGRSGSQSALRLDSSPRDRMLWEFGLLGFCTTGTPFDLMREDVGELTSLQLLASTEPGQQVSVAGSVIRRHSSVNRSGQRTVFLTLEDGTGLGNIVVFSNAQVMSAGSLMRESWLIIEGVVQDRGPAGRSVIANRASPLHVGVGGSH
jgi:DNA polymerase III alpha subunit